MSFIQAMHLARHAGRRARTLVPPLQSRPAEDLAARGRRRARRVAATVVVIGLLAAAPPVDAQSPGEGVPTPESVLGFEPGEDRRLADWDQVLAYVHRLDEASDRVRVDEVGRTTRGRPFVLVTVTSEANQRNLEGIRQANLRLADPRGLGAAEAEALVRRGKAVVAMAFSIHSTEVGGTLTALRLLHELAAGDSEDVRRALDQTVVLVLPSHNPDGTQLVAEWYERQRGTPFEGTEPPVLYHSYVGHDNNRDWYMFTQAETRLTVEHVHRRWHPHITHDVHQMGTKGARLFVPPYADPWEPNVDPALQAAANAIGAHVAGRLISEGRRGVVMNAIFDAWTPARAYPHTHGGVRVLSETASARLATPISLDAAELESRRGGYDPRGRSWNHPAPWPGGTWRIGDIVDYQLSAARAVLDHASRNREYWLRTALAVNRRASAREAPWAFVAPVRQRDPVSAARLLEVLDTGGVEIHRAREDFVAEGRRFEAGSQVILMQQPSSAFAATLLERQHYPDLRGGADGAPHLPYDVTAHTLPLLLGVHVESLQQPFDAVLERVEVPRVAPGLVEGDGPRFALGHTTGDLVVLGRLLAEGIDVEWALEPFADEDRSFAAGTLLVHGKARRRLEAYALELGVTAHAVRARPPALELRSPRVGLYRSWVPSMDEGWTRYVFERDMGVSYRNLHDREVRAGGLRRRYDAIVLPDQPPLTVLGGHEPGTLPDEYTGGLGARGMDALRDFVESGGTLVALNAASGLLIEQLDLPVRDVVAQADPETFFCPGSILRVRTDPSRPLAHGLPEALPIWFESSPVFEAPADAVVARYTRDKPLLSGWLLGEDTLKDRAALVELAVGKGRVVLFGFRPQYRAQSRVTYAALVNALYLSASR